MNTVDKTATIFNVLHFENEQTFQYVRVNVVLN